MRRCTVIISDAEPLNRLWSAGQLDRLLTLGVDLVVVDVVCDALTRDLANSDAQAVKAFIDRYQPPFIIANTYIGELEREKRRNGQESRRNAVELGVADFMSSDEGLRHYISNREPVFILTDDASSIRVFNTPEKLSPALVRPASSDQ